MTEPELRELLLGVYSNQRELLNRLRIVEVVTLSTRQALRGILPNFEETYARYYEEEQSNEAAQAHELGISVIDTIIRRLRGPVN